jgi:hypothetical protein
VAAKSCAEVVSAVALVAALTIDPEAVATPAVVLPPPAAAPPQVAPAPAVAATPLAAAPVGVPVAPLMIAPPPPVAPKPPPPPRPPPPDPWRWVFGVQGELESAVAPRLTFAPRLFADVGKSNSLHFGLSVAGWPNRVDDRPPGNATLTWAAARIEGCPVRLVVLWPCAAVDAGVLHGQGAAPLADRSAATKTWLAADLLLRLVLDPGDLIQVRLEGGLVVPLLKPAFAYQQGSDRAVIHEVPAVGGTVGLGAGLRL